MHEGNRLILRGAAVGGRRSSVCSLLGSLLNRSSKNPVVVSCQSGYGL